MNDLTIIYLTLNTLSKEWYRYQINHLKKSVGSTPIISISREPMKLGENIIQTGKACPWNANRQVLRGAELAKTKYIGIAEDDTLYTKGHFKFRPPEDTVAYNMSRWSVFAWDEKPIFSLINKAGTFAMIAPTDLVVRTHTERINKHPDGYTRGGEIGRRSVEKRLGLKRNKLMKFSTSTPIINVCHRLGMSHTKKTNRKKKYGRMKAYDIPYWGEASKIIDIFNGRGNEA